MTTESGYDEESDALNPTPDETSRMIMSERVEPPNISGLAMVRTVDFWVLFWTVSLCECFCCETMGRWLKSPSVRFRNHV